MPLNQDEIGATLNELITLNKDSAKGFVRAKNDVEDESLAGWFDRLKSERAEMVDALQHAVNRLGEEPEETTTAGGALSRGWLNIKSAMTIERDRTDLIVLEDRLEHEADVLEAYQEAMDGSYPPDIATILQEQHAQISRARQELVRRREAKEAQA